MAENYIYKISKKRNINKYLEELFWMWFYIHTLNHPKDEIRVFNESDYLYKSMYKFVHSLFPNYTVIRIPDDDRTGSEKYYDLPLGSIVEFWQGYYTPAPVTIRDNFEELGLSLHNNQIKVRLFMENDEKLSHGQETFFNQNIADIPGAYYIRAAKIFKEDQKEWTNE